MFVLCLTTDRGWNSRLSSVVEGVERGVIFDPRSVPDKSKHSEPNRNGAKLNYTLAASIVVVKPAYTFDNGYREFACDSAVLLAVLQDTFRTKKKKKL